MERARWKAVLYYSLHIAPLITIFFLEFTDVLYNFKEPIFKQEYTFYIRELAFVLLLIINIVLITIRKIFDLPKNKHVAAIIIVCYLGISSMISLVYGGNNGMQFYSPDKTNIVTFEENYLLFTKSVRIRRSYWGFFSVPIELVEGYRHTNSKFYADFKWLSENDLYVKIYPEQENWEYPSKYYNIINLEKSEIISKEQYENLNAEKYSFKP